MMRRTALTTAATALVVLAVGASGQASGAPEPAEARAAVVVTPVAALAPSDAASTAGAEATPAQRTAEIKARIDSALSGSTASRLSVSVDVAGLGAVYRRGADAQLPPASTEKLYTTFAALHALGPFTTYRTTVRSTAVKTGDRLRGSLYLVASGDPYFSAFQLDSLARQVAAAGIRTVEGALFVDDTRYDRVRSGAGWKREWVPEQSGPLSAMALDRNAWRTDSAYLADPATPVLGRLRSFLAQRGVTVTGGTGRAAVASSAKELGFAVSGTMAATVQRIDKASDNFASELLLKELGRVKRGAGTSASGAAAVRQVLSPLGAGVGTVADGSGLSRNNLQSSLGEVRLLQAADRSSSARWLRSALPIACRDGTLRRRLCGTAAEGRFLAKTGTLDTSRALAGFGLTADGHQVQLSFLLSGFSDGNAARAAIDRAVAAIAASRAGS